MSLRKRISENLSGTTSNYGSALSEAFEVRCYNCDVTFPVGTKRCMHCGGKPGQQALFVPEIMGDPLGDFESLQREDESASPFGKGETPRRPKVEDTAEEEPEQASPLMRILSSFGWLIVFAAITAYRQCAG
ncbi:MAG: hypothetical protein ACI8W3_001092 [Myxococcota bacterium]|jgi:hypothetical protein